jgi:hypothetical protein
LQVGERVLILGASYGSLLAIKLLLAGYGVRLVCPAATAALINGDGIRVIVPVKGMAEPVELDSRALRAPLSASAPSDVDPADHSLAVLAMQEPHFGAPEIRELVRAIAAASIPCLSIMNMPPLPYLARLPGLAGDALRSCYADAAAWDALPMSLTSHCSADAQASRVAARPENVMRVLLPTNFRAARFESEEHTATLRRIAADIDAARLETEDGALAVPVRLKVHDSVFVPLSKWPMLLTGNYRCIGADGLRSIRDAVHSDIAESRGIYAWVAGLCRRMGAAESDLVPFEAYAAAASVLAAPSSAARALEAGALQIERVDRLVQAIAIQNGMRLPALDTLVARVDARLAANRAATLT